MPILASHVNNCEKYYVLKSIGEIMIKKGKDNFFFLKTNNNKRKENASCKAPKVGGGWKQ